MVISQPPRNNPSYYYRASPTLPQLLWMLPETPYVLCMQLQHQVLIEMVLLSTYFYESDPRRDHQRIVLYSFCPPALALHLAVKILLQIFLYNLSTLTLHTSVSCISLRMPAGPHFVTQPILLSENIPNIWRKSSTKHKEVRPDWNDKNDNANCNASLSWKVLPMAQVAILRKYSIKCERFRLWIVLFWTKTSQRLTLYLLSNTDNIHIVLENDNTVLIKRT